MRAYPLVLLLFPLAGLAGTPLPSFDDKLPEPTLSMSEAARRGESLRRLASPITDQLARNAVMRSEARRPSTAEMPVLKPRDDVDYKMRVHAPDESVDYKIRVVPGERTPR